MDMHKTKYAMYIHEYISVSMTCTSRSRGENAIGRVWSFVSRSRRRGVSNPGYLGRSSRSLMLSNHTMRNGERDQIK